MRVIIFFLIIFLLWITELSFSAEYQLAIHPQGIGISPYTSIGFSNLNESTISELAGANPASMSAINVPAFGISFNYVTTAEIKFADDFYYRFGRSSQWLPSSLTYVHPFKNIRIGFGIHEAYNELFKFGELEITTIEEPEGTGESFSSLIEIYIYSASGMFSYTLKNFLLESDEFTIGTQLCWDFLNTEEKIYKSKTTLDDNSVSFRIGTIYTINRQHSIGMMYEKGIDIEGRINMDNNILIEHDIIPENDTTAIYALIDNSYRIEFPDKLVLGFLSKTAENLTVSTTLSAVFWSGYDNDLQDRLDVSFSARYDYSELLNFVLGYYSTDKNTKDTEYMYLGYPQNATFLSAGIKVNFKTATINVVLNDSHLFSAKSRQQTAVKAGLDYYFGN